MDIKVDTTSPEKLRTGVLVLGVFADGQLPAPARVVDEAAKGKLSAVIGRGDLDAAAGDSLLLHDVPGTAAERVLLVSLGKRNALGDRTFRDALGSAAKTLAGGVAREAGVALGSLELPSRTPAWRAEQAARLLADGAYRFDAPGTTRSAAAARERGARKISLLIGNEAAGAGIDGAVRRGLAVAEGMALTKDLGNLGGNICNPVYLAQTSEALGKEFGFEVEVLERADMEKLGMGSALSVGRASYWPCKFIVMHYRGGPTSAKPIVLVGKGLTFDTGGISLKPGADMDEMKYDMSGGGSVIGLFKTVARLALPLNIVGIVPAVENMLGGNASRPGDVVTSMSGQTIEILNTDAEGRLALCDAMTYAERLSLPASSMSPRSPAPASSRSVPSPAVSSPTTTRSRRNCSRVVPIRATAPGTCRFSTSTRPSSRATLPTCPTSADAPQGRSPRPASSRASPTRTSGRTWTSPARHRCRGTPRGRLAGPSLCWPNSWSAELKVVRDDRAGSRAIVRRQTRYRSRKENAACYSKAASPSRTFWSTSSPFSCSCCGSGYWSRSWATCSGDETCPALPKCCG